MFGKGFPFLNPVGGFYPRGNFCPFKSIESRIVLESGMVGDLPYPLLVAC